MHRGSVLTSTHQPERLVCSPTGVSGGWELRLGEVRSQGEDWGWLCEHSLKGASAPQLAGRESRKKSGPAKETRDHCFRVCKERGFLSLVPTVGRAPPKRAPEKGASGAISTDTRDRHETLRLLPLPPRILCASTGHYPQVPSWEPVQPATARVP